MNDETQLLTKYEYLVSYIWRRNVFKTQNILFWKEDIYQEGRIGLLNAIRNYNENEEASFETFACTCIKNKMLESIRLHYRNKYGLFDGKGTVSLYTEICDDAGVHPLNLEEIIPDPYEESISKDMEIKDYLNDVILITKTVKVRQREVIKRLLKGCSQSSIGRELGLTRQAINIQWFNFVKRFKLYEAKKEANAKELPRESKYKTKRLFIKDLTRYLSKRKEGFKPNKKYLKDS